MPLRDVVHPERAVEDLEPEHLPKALLVPAGYLVDLLLHVNTISSKPVVLNEPPAACRGLEESENADLPWVQQASALHSTLAQAPSGGAQSCRHSRAVGERAHQRDPLLRPSGQVLFDPGLEVGLCRGVAQLEVFLRSHEHLSLHVHHLADLCQVPPAKGRLEALQDEEGEQQDVGARGSQRARPHRAPPAGGKEGWLDLCLLAVQKTSKTAEPQAAASVCFLRSITTCSTCRHYAELCRCADPRLVLTQ